MSHTCQSCGGQIGRDCFNPGECAGITAQMAQQEHSQWQPIETAPKDTAVLTYGFGYEIAHYNTDLDAWVACWDHRPIRTPVGWMPLPESPMADKARK